MGNARVYSVTQINRYIKSMFEQDFLLDHVTVSGELSGCKYHSSGHIYFNLKDEGGLIPAVMWAGTAKNLKLRLKDGDRVEVTGKIEVYEKQGRYQIIASRIEVAGLGDLFAHFMELKNALSEAGYFDDSYKKPIPPFAKRIGVITAETGAAIRDIISISRRRNPFVEIYLFPARVQGEGAAASCIEGLEILDFAGVDVIILGRGGGSMEDLWCFNDEELAKAIFHCETPVVSAVGHETDFTIADFVADLRAPTPSAAAELCVFDYEAAVDMVRELYRKACDSLLSKTGMARLKRDRLLAALKSHDPVSSVELKKKEADALMMRLVSSFDGRMVALKHRYSVLSERLDAVSPLKKISGGYALVLDKDGKKLTEPGELKVGDDLSLYMEKGVVDVTVKATRSI